MIIRRTEKNYLQLLKTWHKEKDTSRHEVLKRRITWWFLFIPIYSYEVILSSNLKNY